MPNFVFKRQLVVLNLVLFEVLGGVAHSLVYFLLSSRQRCLEVLVEGLGVRFLFVARIRVTPRMTVTIRLFSSNGHKSGTIGSGLASRAQNCPLFDWTRSGYRAITCFVSSEQRGPHVCLRTRSSRQGTPEEREVKSDSSEVSDTL